MGAPRVLVTGAAGYLGSQLVAALAAGARRPAALVAMDVREVAAAAQRPGIIYATADIRAPDLAAMLRAACDRHGGAPGIDRHAGQEQ